jgi:hypothetical protein
MNRKMTPERYRIAAITCYFGKKPWYFDLFLKSAGLNARVDFILVTDFTAMDECPENVHVIPSTLSEVKARARKALGIDVMLETPYKLCDFKPAYGLIFSDLLKDYDFWGHADIDIVYGRLDHFLTPEMLASHDLITLCSTYIAGFFTLFRNNVQMNTLFMQSKDYKKVFQDPSNFCFDECNWQWIALAVEQKTVFQISSEIESMTYVVKKLSFCGEIRAFFSNLSQDVGRVKWESGRLTSGAHEVMLFHLIKFKGKYFKHVPSWKVFPNKFYINDFYISTTGPDSLQGKTLHRYMTLARGSYIWYQRFKAWLSWMSKKIQSSRKIDGLQFPRWRSVPGVYRLQEDNFQLSIIEKGGSLFARISPQREISLLHWKKNKFILSKFRPNLDGDPDNANDMNFEIEFTETQGERPTMLIKYHLSGILILQKK